VVTGPTLAAALVGNHILFWLIDSMQDLESDGNGPASSSSSSSSSVAEPLPPRSTTEVIALQRAAGARALKTFQPQYKVSFAVFLVNLWIQHVQSHAERLPNSGQYNSA
jgi:hypothetical protein